MAPFIQEQQQVLRTKCIWLFGSYIKNTLDLHIKTAQNKWQFWRYQKWHFQYPQRKSETTFQNKHHSQNLKTIITCGMQIGHSEMFFGHLIHFEMRNQTNFLNLTSTSDQWTITAEMLEAVSSGRWLVADCCC